jgi:hypothetical protein
MSLRRLERWRMLTQGEKLSFGRSDRVTNIDYSGEHGSCRANNSNISAKRYGKCAKKGLPQVSSRMFRTLIENSRFKPVPGISLTSEI